MMSTKLGLFLSSLFILSACTPDIELHAPDDGVISACSQGAIGNTRVSCATPWRRIASTAEGNTALVVLIEPGDYNSNSPAVQSDQSVRLLSSSIPSQFSNIKQHLRQIFINLSVSHIKYLVNTFGSRYDHIYFLRTDVEWNPYAISLALKNVLTYNKTVDLLLQVHGTPGSISLNSNFSSRLTIADLENMKAIFSLRQRERVRSIFNTACYSAQTGYEGGVVSSIAGQLSSLFPRATTYGSFGVNYAPLLRDAVAFENYYARGWDFYFATGSFSNWALTRTIASNYSAPRTSLPNPVFAIRGQARYLGFRKTVWQNFSLPALNFDAFQQSGSVAIVFPGSYSSNTTIFTQFEDWRAETDTRSPAEYMGPAVCLYNGGFLEHGTVFFENEDQVSCYDGQISRVAVAPPEPPPQDVWLGGGY